MKKTLTLLVATTALTAALGLPALAMMGMGDRAQRSHAAAFDGTAQDIPLIRVSDDSEDDDDDSDRSDDDSGDDGDGSSDDGPRDSDRAQSGNDDDDDDDDCDRAADGSCLAGQGNPAPAGTVAPPKNGLFGNGKPPVAVTN